VRRCPWSGSSRAGWTRRQKVACRAAHYSIVDTTRDCRQTTRGRSSAMQSLHTHAFPSSALRCSKRPCGRTQWTSAPLLRTTAQFLPDWPWVRSAMKRGKSSVTRPGPQEQDCWPHGHASRGGRQLTTGRHGAGRNQATCPKSPAREAHDWTLTPTQPTTSPTNAGAHSHATPDGPSDYAAHRSPRRPYDVRGHPRHHRLPITRYRPRWRRGHCKATLKRAPRKAHRPAFTPAPPAR